MKNAKRFFVITFMLAFIMSISSINAFAATVTQDNLEVTLVTDKEKYAEDEQIKTTLTVKNNNDTAVTNVDLETALPDGYKLAAKSENKKTVDSISAGESVSLDVTLEKDNTKKESTPSEPSTDSKSSTNPVSGGNSGGSGTTTGGTTTNGSAVQTGQGFLVVGIVLLVLLSSGILFVFVYRRKHLGKKIISVILCIGILGSSGFLLKVSVKAEETQTKTITISETVEVGNNDLAIVSIVKFGFETEEKGLDKPDNPTDADNFYWDNSEKVLRVIKVTDSDKVLTESEAVKTLRKRGFTDYPVTYSYNMNGEFTDSTNAKDDSSDKHPYYETNFLSAENCLWRITIMEDAIIANPVSFILESDSISEVLFSESKKLTSYNNNDNKYYVTVPKESVVIVKEISTINANTLDKITSEEVFAK